MLLLEKIVIILITRKVGFKMKKMCLVLLVCLTLCGCAQNSSVKNEPEFTSEVSVTSEVSADASGDSEVIVIGDDNASEDGTVESTEVEELNTER